MRSEAQRAADKRYREKTKGKDVSWGTRLKPDEAREIDDLLKKKNMTRADFLRTAAKLLK